MRKKLLFIAIGIFSCAIVNAQSYYNNIAKTIPGNGNEVFDTINVNSLGVGAINGFYGLDSVTLNISYSNDEDLVISLISPDGTEVQLADKAGGGSDFTGTCFTMSVTNLVNDANAPYYGTMRPEDWLGRFNNGQSGTGNWVLHVINTTSSNNTGTILNWGIHFDSHPAPGNLLSSSTLPIVVVNTDNDAVIPYDEDVKVYGTMGIIWNGAGQINNLTDPFNNYNGHISAKVRGNSTRYFAQKAFSIETEDASGNNFNVSLLGMPSDNDWVLYAPYDDKSLIRNIITYQMSNDMGEYAPRTRLCELVLNGDYRGVYVLMEKIKQGSNRVNVTKLHTTDTSGNNLTGGYIFEVDRDAGSGSWNSNYLSCLTGGSNIHFAYVYPKSTDINSQQKQYIANYVDQFETSLISTSLYDTTNGYRKYIDVPSFMDQSLLQEIGHNVDGYRLSSYLHKDRNGKLAGGPIWDFNESYGNADYYGGSDYNTFEWDLPCTLPDGDLNPFWWQKFLTDTNYVKDLKCRYTQLRSNVFDTVSMNRMIDSLVGLLQVPQQRHFQRWPILGQYVWPNAYVGSSWQDEITYLKGWLANRVTWMDSALLDTSCVFPPPDTGVAVRNVNALQSIRVYPNPAAEELHITSGTDITGISIYNMVGQLVYDNKMKSRTYDISLKEYHINTGVYSILLYTDEGILRKKVIVSRE